MYEDAIGERRPSDQKKEKLKGITACALPFSIGVFSVLEGDIKTSTGAFFTRLLHVRRYRASKCYTSHVVKLPKKSNRHGQKL